MFWNLPLFTNHYYFEIFLYLVITWIVQLFPSTKKLQNSICHHWSDLFSLKCFCTSPSYPLTISSFSPRLNSDISSVGKLLQPLQARRLARPLCFHAALSPAPWWHFPTRRLIVCVSTACLCGCMS